MSAEVKKGDPNTGVHFDYPHHSRDTCSKGGIVEWRAQGNDSFGERVGVLFSSVVRPVFVNSYKAARWVFVSILDNCITKFFWTQFKSAVSCVWNTASSISNFIIRNIKAIVCNSYTKAVSEWVWNTILTPTGRAVKSVAEFIFVTCLWNWVGKPLFDRICIAPSEKAGESSTKTDTGSGPRFSKIADLISSIWNWTVAPLNRHVLRPTVETAWDWVVLPAWDHLIYPGAIKPTGNLINGIWIGIFGKVTPLKSIGSAEQPLSSDEITKMLNDHNAEKEKIHVLAIYGTGGSIPFSVIQKASPTKCVVLSGVSVDLPENEEVDGWKLDEIFTATSAEDALGQWEKSYHDFHNGNDPGEGYFRARIYQTEPKSSDS